MQANVLQIRRCAVRLFECYLQSGWRSLRSQGASRALGSGVRVKKRFGESIWEMFGEKFGKYMGNISDIFGK